ncbi:MAG: ABC transporter permease [Chloroflexi bacterium]|nr:ABC transporter permease [Chloroflexota bacterium]
MAPPVRRHALIASGGVGAFIILWQLTAMYLVDPFFLPTPTSVLIGAVNLLSQGTLISYVAVSLLRIFVGWALGSLLAIPIGLFIGISPLFRALVDPFIHFFRFIPAIAFLTLFMVWFGVGETSKILLIMYATGFIVTINTATGVTSIPQEKLDAGRVLGANPRQLFFHVTVPASIPFIFVGMRLALASSFLVIVAAEMLAANSGLGYLIWTSRLFFRIDWMFTGIVAIGILGFLSDRLWRWIGRHFLYRYLREITRY